MKRKIRDPEARRHEARRKRVVSGLAHSDRPWLTVYRSSKHIYAQLVDSVTGQTITTVSTLSIESPGEAEGKTAAARRVGQAIAKVARERQIEKVVFNRNGFLYHGRVKALADAAREAGLQF
jgi:large subunit ribosomal protein L18